MKLSTLVLWTLVSFLSHAFAIEFSIPAGANIEMRDDSHLLEEDTLLWGPYRSGLYFGIRPRIPRSLLSGLMWYNVDSYANIGNFRHFYEQNDNMKKANWVNFDPRIGGKQVIEDNDCHITVTIDFIKSEDGKSWGVKIHSKPHQGFESVKTSFVWYSGLETSKGIDIVGSPIKGMDGNESGGEDGAFYFDNAKNLNGYRENMKFSGISETLGMFLLEINDGPISNKHPKQVVKQARDLNPQRTHHISLRVVNDNIWRAKDIFTTILQDSIKNIIEEYENLENFPPEQALIIRDLLQFEGNLHFVQKIFEGECEFDIIFTAAVTPDEDKITFENLSQKIKIGLEKVDEKFDQHFSPLSAPFDVSHTKKYKTFGKEIMSGLLGGLTYSHGLHLVDRESVLDEESFEKFELKGKLEGPHDLFSLVPSRPFFPRGFYWDEGFHLLPLLKYDPDLVLEIIKSWFNLIDESGWIAREQILGPELRSRVPEEFQSQSPEIVNPPTLMLAFSYVLDDLIGNIDSNSFGDLENPEMVDEYGSFDDSNKKTSSIVENPALLLEYSKEIYPKLKAHYEMFRRTQKGYNEDFGRERSKEMYRWRGRTLTHCFASGLDDYPRTLPADIAELNVDLLSWMGVMTRSMKLLASLLKYEDDLAGYSAIEAEIVENIDKIHWSKEEKTYCDVTVDEDDENIHSCNKGYISLFPFLTKLVPNHDVEKLSHIVELISDPEELWSPYGIRSLSKNDEFYRTEENYWRSPIWLNMNYLILESLQHYQEELKQYMDKKLKAKVAETYKQLRLNLVNNVVDQWEKTGFVWEQYDDETGNAKGAKNFLGWTSTILLIMKMPTSI